MLTKLKHIAGRLLFKAIHFVLRKKLLNKPDWYNSRVQAWHEAHPDKKPPMVNVSGEVRWLNRKQRRAVKLKYRGAGK